MVSTRRKVLHVVNSLNFGGVESRMRIIGFNQHMSSFEHTFCAIGNGGAVSDELVSAGFSVSLLRKKTKIPSVAAILELIGEIKSCRPSVIHCHGAQPSFHGLIAGRICGVPVCIAEEIGIPNHSSKAKFVFRYIYRLADALVAISQAVKEHVTMLGEVNIEKVQVIHNPTQMLSQRAKSKSSDQFRLGFVGRLEEVKNPLALIQAVGQLGDRGLAVHLTIVGDGSQRKLLDAEVKRLGIEKAVRFSGFDAFPFKKLNDIDLYLQPSISEGFGLAIVEAMSAGIPVLVTPVGGTQDILIEGYNGWYLLGTDVDAISRAIEKCARLPVKELDIIGRNGRKSVIDKFSPAKYVASCDRFYSRLLYQRSR